MRRHPVCLRLSAALLFAMGGLAHAGSTASVQSMSLTDTDGWTRASIQLDTAARYDVFTLANPDRLVVDLHQAHLADSFRVPGPNGLVANVRTGQPVPGDVRLVFELDGKATPRASLERADGAARLVVRLHDPAPRVTSRDAGKSRGAGMPVDGASLAAVNPQPDPAVTAPQRAQEVPTRNPPPHLDADHAPAVAVAAKPVSATEAALDEPDRRALAVFVPSPPGARSPTMPAQADPATLSPATPAPSTPTPVEPETEASFAAGADHAPSAPPPATADATPAALPPPGARTVRDVLGSHPRKIVIAVDAGHGGKDVGAKGFSGSYEKNVTLATARELARQIDATPGLRAVLTRDGDYFVPLAERYRKAREAKADLFISIHCDADPTHSASGSSVWVLSERGVTSQAARWLADRENAADLVGGVKLSDKDDTLASVLLDLSQSATMKASEDAAERVHQALRDIGRTHKAHPEHANFVVLRSPDVPSMLVETAFITNPVEERHLNDPRYRTQLAHAVLSGVESYFISTPLPGTEFAALHPRPGSRARLAAAAPSTTSAGTGGVDADVPAAPRRARAAVVLAAADQGQSIHVVQRGESLRDIAERFGVSLMRLRQINDLQGNRIRPGQTLRIPARADNG